MENKILYFSYGANSRKEMMEAITGNKNLVGKLAILKGFALCVQRLDQVPDAVLSSSPVSLSPKKILEESWSDKFRTYMIKPKENSEVEGMVWELTPQERELVRDWELIDLGWYKDMRVKIITEEGKEIEVETEGFREGQEVDREVNGRNYKPFLNRLEDFQRVARKSREEYFARLKMQEGVIPKE